MTEGTTRRSGRARKSVVKFSEDVYSGNKKTGTAADQSDQGNPDVEGDEPEESDEAEVDELDDSEGEEFQAPKAAKAKGKKAPAKKRAAPKTSRKRKAAALDDDSQASEGADLPENEPLLKGEYAIARDNALFEAVRHSETALELTVDEWIEAYQANGNDNEEAKGEPLAELINFVIRCCGCNASIDKHEVLDVDNVMDKLIEIQDDFQKVAARAYPLIASSKALKAFRKSLTEFITRLTDNTNTSGILYDEHFCEIFQSWLVAATSSKLRSFRHTTTVVVLEFITALCGVATEVDKEFGSVSRQRDAEAKKTRKDKSRLQTLEAKVKDTHEKKVILEGYFKDLLDGVFIHRYRDAEPAIRSECIRALGLWMKKHPDHFLEGNHLRYVGWVLTDVNKEARLEAIKSLHSLYSKADYIGTLQHFTERFKARFVEMACSEPDLNVRKAALSVLELVDKHGLLEEDQRADIAKLLFHIDPKIRAAAAPFFVSIVEEDLEERVGEGAAGGPKDSDVARARLWYKSLAAALVKFGQATAPEDVEEDSQESQSSSKKVADDAEASLREVHHGRAGLALQALWDEAESAQQWPVLVDYLLLDHSEDAEQLVPASQGPSSPGKRGRKTLGENEMGEGHRLEEAEETLLVEVLAASLERVREDALASSKDEDEDHEDISELTRSMMKNLPRFFTKYSTDSSRLSDILRIPRVLNLDLYLEMRMLTAYEALWDHISKHFVKHSDHTVLVRSISAIQSLLSCASLSEANNNKFGAFVSSMMSSIRDSVAGKEIEVCSFSEEELAHLSAWMTRLSMLIEVVDVVPQMDDTQGMKQTSVSVIVDALADRGRLGDLVEEKMICHTLNILLFHSMRSANHLRMSEEDPSDDKIATYVQTRASMLEKMTDYAVGTQSMACEEVKRASFSKLVMVYTFSSQIGQPPSTGERRLDKLASLRLQMDDELQSRCAGFVEAEIERHSARVSDKKGETSRDNGSGSDTADSDEEQATNTKGKETARNKKAIDSQGADDKPRDMQSLAADYAFNNVLATFVRSITMNIIDIRHATIVLAHYGRFGPFFDNCAKILTESLKDEGLYGENTVATTSVVVDTLREVMDMATANVQDEESVQIMSRLLLSCISVRGPRLSIAKRLPGEYAVKLHSDLIDYTLSKYLTLKEQNKVPERNMAITMFKALTTLSLVLEAQDALKIQTHLDQALESKDITIATASKIWDPERAYVKRLTGIMAKDRTVAQAAKKARPARTTEDAPSDEEMPPPGLPKKGARKAPRAKAKPTKAPAPPTRTMPNRRASGAATYAEDTAEQPEEEDELETAPKQTNPRPATHKSGPGTAEEELPDLEEEQATPGESVLTPRLDSPPSPRRSASPTASVAGVKRTLREAQAGEESDQEDQEVEAELSLGASQRAGSVDSQISVSDIKKKRRRL